jgi:hypothetical protein
MSQINTSIIQNSGRRDVTCPPKIRVNTGANCRRRAGIRLFKAMFAAVIFGGAHGAWALPIGFGTNCSVSGGTSAQSGSPDALSNNPQTLSGGCGSQVTSNGRVVVPVVTDAGPSLFNFDQTAMTSANARVGLGSLGASSISETTSTPVSYSYTTNGNGGITEDDYVAGGNSSATATWWDSLTIGGTPNTNGFIVLEFSLDLHGQTFTSPIGASASILSRFFIDDGDRYRSEQILDLSTPGTVSNAIGFRPGQEVHLYGDLNAITQSSAGRQYVNVCNPFFCFPVRGDYVPGSDAVADAANTAGFHIDVLTPGGSYSTLSGETYITAEAPPGTVAEPGTAWLLSSALLGSIAVMRRRGRLRVDAVSKKRTLIKVPTGSTPALRVGA